MCSSDLVTIVPSEGNTGEVSYVLIVQQPENDEDKDEKDDDLKVFDFDDNEDPNAVVRAEAIISKLSQ